MSEQWYPDNDPITGDQLFMVIKHPTKGMVPTYGGPFDSYTLAEIDQDESTDEEIHYTRERYDHDEGAWIENEIEGLSVVLVAEEKIFTLKAQRDELLAAAKAYQELSVCYRLNKRPTEKLFDRLETANFAIANAEARPCD